jgi:aspartate/methionine/tyrosine aminotransferase
MSDPAADVSLRKDSPSRGASTSLVSSSTRGVRTAARVASFTESVIREMTRLSNEHGAINLAQGFPDFAAPAELTEAAVAAIRGDVNQYPITWGSRDLREAIAASYERRGWPSVDPASEVTVTCGSTEAMAAAFLSLIDPGDEIILLEPFYENYGPDSHLAGATVRTVALYPPDWRLDPDELRAAVSSRTRAIVINTPHNPSGKVFGAADLEAIARLCVEHDLLAFTDEIYEHILYDGAEHRFLARQPGMAERTVTISALSKTYSVTGWRVGWIVAAAPLTAALRKTHDFLTVASPAPLQAAGAVALGFGAEFYARLADDYLARRDLLVPALGAAGFPVSVPQGAYYVMADITAHAAAMGAPDDTAFCRRLVEEAGVASVPGSSFYRRPADGARYARFAFPKRRETLDAAGERLVAFGRRLGLA